MITNRKVYESWKPVQYAKYESMFQKIRDRIRKGSLFDYGIGPGWLEMFFDEKGVRFDRIVGFDPEPKMTEPKLANVEYVHSGPLEEEFDNVFCIDTAHLLKEPEEELPHLVRKGGLLVVSVPMRFMNKMPEFKSMRVLEKGIVGSAEKDFFWAWEKV